MNNKKVCSDCGQEIDKTYMYITVDYVITEHCEDCWVIVHGNDKE